MGVGTSSFSSVRKPARRRFGHDRETKDDGAGSRQESVGKRSGWGRYPGSRRRRCLPPRTPRYGLGRAGVRWMRQAPTRHATALSTLAAICSQEPTVQALSIHITETSSIVQRSARPVMWKTA